MRLLVGVALIFVTTVSANQISYDSDPPTRKQEPKSPSADHFTLKYHNEKEKKKPVQVTEAIYLNNFSKTILDILSAFKMVTISDDIPQEGKEVIESSPTDLQKQITIGGFTLFNPLTGLSFGIVTLVGVLAFLGAGAASLLGFMVPPLQIANQILSIIALALFLAYYFEDKKYAPNYDYYEGHSYGYDQGYDSYGSSSYSGYDRMGAAYPYDMSDIYRYTAGEALSEVTEKISAAQKEHDPHSYAMKLNKYQKKGTSLSESLSNQIGSQARSFGVSLFANLGNFMRSGVKRMSSMMS